MAAYQNAHSSRATHGLRSLAARDLSVETIGEPEERPACAEPKPIDTYERLMAGETVSWQRIMWDNPMLGTITVAQLVNTGVVQVMPEYDPITGAIDFHLRKRKP